MLVSEAPGRDALVAACLRDIHAVEVMIGWRLPAILRQAGQPHLLEIFARITGGGTARAARLRAVRGDVNGPGSVWMSGMVDDAERVAQDIPPGPFLDFALAGIMRRALAAVLACYATVEGLSTGALRDAVAQNRAELAGALEALVAALPSLAADCERV